MMPVSGAAVRRLPFVSVPEWDISQEEISEWRQTPGMRFAGFTAGCIADGQYDNGQELYPPGSGVYREITREAVDQAMGLLAERGMVRKSGGSWYAIAPGRLAPGAHRAVAVLLACRADLPPALANELESWKQTLDCLEAPGGTLACQAPTGPPVQPTRPVHAVKAG